MRTIKFRAWNIDKKIMVYYDEDNSEEYFDGVCITDVAMVNSSLENSEYIWEQFTGLQDKNGVDIYAGDKIKYDTKEESNECGVGVVEDCPGSFIVWWDMDNTNFETLMTVLWYLGCPKYLEVVGNIHEE